MKSLFNVLLLAVAALAAACSSGGAAPGPPGGSGNLTASFVPGEPNPGTNEVTMNQGQAASDTLVVEIKVTDTNGIFGAAFDLTFDTDFVSYVPTAVSSMRGTLLEQGGGQIDYHVGTATAGRLVVSAARLSQGTVNAVGTVTLMRLTFRVEDVGSSPLFFLNGDLLDGQVQPQPLPGLQWWGGTMIGT